MQTYQQPQTLPQNNPPWRARRAAANAPAGYGNCELNETENGFFEPQLAREDLGSSRRDGALYTFGASSSCGRLSSATSSPGSSIVTAPRSWVRIVARQGRGDAGQRPGALMEGAKKLSRAFTIQIVMAIIGFLLVRLAVVPAIVLAVAAALRARTDLGLLRHAIVRHGEIAFSRSPRSPHRRRPRPPSRRRRDDRSLRRRRARHERDAVGDGRTRLARRDALLPRARTTSTRSRSSVAARAL